MRADFKIVLDACVMANIGVCDLLLRLAETPRLYLPRWSAEILAETHRTHLDKLGWPEYLATKFQDDVTAAFPESLVTEYEHLIGHCGNDPKDRHVLACAIHIKAEVIVTFNLKDFAEEHLSPWGITSMHPDDCLVNFYSIDPVVVLHKLEARARERAWAFEDYMIRVGKYLPKFARRIIEAVSA